MTSDERDRALAKLESLLSTSPVGIAFFDRDLQSSRINDALASLLPELGAALQPLLQRALAGEVLRDCVLDQGERAYLASVFPVRLRDGTIGGAGAMVTDITESRRIEAELRRAVQIREDVLAVVSHDLRAPLSNIDLTASMIRMQYPDNPSRHLDVIHRSVTRMRHLIDDLVDSASIRAGRLALQMQPEPAAALLAEAADLQEALAIERGIRIERAHDLDGHRVTCDRQRILQVFGNLLGNAIKFCRPGGRIIVDGRCSGEAVQFSVADDGPGIDPHVVPALFDPYHSPPEHAHAGSGLGLHICKGIIERHGGQIWADLSVERGTTMRFTLPLSRSST